MTERPIVTTVTSGQPDGEPDRIRSGAPDRVAAVIRSLGRIVQSGALLDFRPPSELMKSAFVTGAQAARKRLARERESVGLKSIGQGLRVSHDSRE